MLIKYTVKASQEIQPTVVADRVRAHVQVHGKPADNELIYDTIAEMLSLPDNYIDWDFDNRQMTDALIAAVRSVL